MARAEEAPQIDEHRFDLLPEAEPMAVQDIRDALVIRERDMFLFTDMSGQVPRGNVNGYGLYHRDTRYLSGYEFSFSNARPLTLLSTAELGYSSEHVMTNPAMLDTEGRRVPRGSIHVRRQRALEDVLEETITVSNYNIFPVSIEVVFRFEADFCGIFEVRGYEPERRGQHEAPSYADDALLMRYIGSDAHRRETMITFDPEPDYPITDSDVAFITYRLQIEPKQGREIRVVVSVDGRLETPLGDERFRRVSQSYSDWRAGCAEVVSDNHFFNAIMQRSLDDIRMLWHAHDADSGFPAAGTPWYDALFGRDSCIAGIQTLAFAPNVARQCLIALARHQGTRFDAWRDEEPGKILHESREDELTAAGELPFSPYFGSIDSTPLFMLLAGEYFRWTADAEFLRQLQPNLAAAMHWIDEYGDPNGDGYIEYEKRSVKGLVNQGWKDSHDSMVHADGSLMAPPITLIEVQAYAYASMRRLADAYVALGDDTLAAKLKARANALKEEFNDDFWVEEEGCFALGIDGVGRRAASVTSNAGHALWCGIASPHKGRATAQRLMRGDMYSGWGIRTLTSESPRYNPQGYHLGTVWPHDNSILAMGFRRYGAESELVTIASSLLRAARDFQYHRLPELFGGGELSPHLTPVPYPVACRPQAWAAGSVPLITQALLGLCPDALNRRLYIVHPQLPDGLDRVEVSGLRIGEASVKLLYQRRGPDTWVRTLDVAGDLKVEVVNDWPGHLL
jgi:glycogen debranching enzyme